MKEEGSNITILIVDDSPLNRDVLTTIIETDPIFTILGYAGNGREAIQLAAKMKPDIITMDLNMPIMDGFEAIENIMAYHPTPILVVTTAEFEKNATIAFEALAVGALDIINRPQLSDTFESGDIGQTARDFILKLKLLSEISVITHVRGKLSRRGRLEAELTEQTQGKVVVIASSTGGPKALKEVFDRLPEDFPAPLLVVQHMSEGFVPGLARWLNTTSKLTILVPEDKDVALPGHIYIAPTGYHLRVKKGGQLILSDQPPVNGLRPCADLLFESAAATYGSHVLAVILSGMGNDGTLGSGYIKQSGGRVIVQDNATCVIASMPQNAAAAVNVDAVSPITEIALEMQKQFILL